MSTLMEGPRPYIYPQVHSTFAASFLPSSVQLCESPSFESTAVVLRATVDAALTQSHSSQGWLYGSAQDAAVTGSTVTKTWRPLSCV